MGLTRLGARAVVLIERARALGPSTATSPVVSGALVFSTSDMSFNFDS